MVRPALQNFTGSGYSGGSSGSAAQEQRQIMEIRTQPLAARVPDRQALMRGLPASRWRLRKPTPQAGAQETDNEAMPEVKAVDTAAADGTRYPMGRQQRKFAQMTSGLDRAIPVAWQQPTGSGVGAVVDKEDLNAMGMSTRGRAIASQRKLRCQAGWYRTFPAWKVRRSNLDVENYKTMAGMVGDRTKPLKPTPRSGGRMADCRKKYARNQWRIKHRAIQNSYVKTGLYNGRKVVQSLTGAWTIAVDPRMVKWDGRPQTPDHRPAHGQSGKTCHKTNPRGFLASVGDVAQQSALRSAGSISATLLAPLMWHRALAGKG